MYRYVLVALLLAQPRPEPLLRIEAPLELAALRVNLKVFQRRYKMQIAVFLPDIAIKLGVIDPLRKANPRCVYSTKSQHHVEERWWHGSARHTLWRDHHFDSCSRS